eukprot:Amastigsp_a340737_50.p2 type:complete len:140 gc:universal Amastigsp_a340737_50:842-423(-)
MIEEAQFATSKRVQATFLGACRSADGAQQRHSGRGTYAGRSHHDFDLCSGILLRMEQRRWCRSLQPVKALQLDACLGRARKSACAGENGRRGRDRGFVEYVQGGCARTFFAVRGRAEEQRPSHLARGLLVRRVDRVLGE